MSLLVSEGGNARKYLPLKKLEGGSTPGGDVAHISGLSGLLGGGNGVTSTNDGDGTSLGDIGQDVDNAKGSFGEGINLEDSHRPVHDDGLAV